MILENEQLRERYLRDPFPVQLGGIAANLVRISSWSDNDEQKQAVRTMINESKYFIEWMAPEAELDVQVTLVELQIQLALWQNILDCIWNEPASRAAFATQAGRWADRILDMSGLLEGS